MEIDAVKGVDIPTEGVIKSGLGEAFPDDADSLAAARGKIKWCRHDADEKMSFFGV
jgi:hypothetical protein